MSGFYVDHLGRLGESGRLADEDLSFKDLSFKLFSWLFCNCVAKMGESSWKRVMANQSLTLGCISVDTLQSSLVLKFSECSRGASWSLFLRAISCIFWFLNNWASANLRSRKFIQQSVIFIFLGLIFSHRLLKKWSMLENLFSFYSPFAILNLTEGSIKLIIAFLLGLGLLPARFISYPVVCVSIWLSLIIKPVDSSLWVCDAMALFSFCHSGTSVLSYFSDRPRLSSLFFPLLGTGIFF